MGGINYHEGAGRMTVTREAMVRALVEADFENWPFGIDMVTAEDRYGDMADAAIELLEGTQK